MPKESQESKSESEIRSEWKSGETLSFQDKDYDDNELKRLLYNETFDDYLSNCSLKLDSLEWDVNVQILFERIYYSVKDKINFISESRLKITLKKIVGALCLIDGRKKPNDMDFAICKQLMDKCFQWVTLEELKV